MLAARQCSRAQAPGLAARARRGPSPASAASNPRRTADPGAGERREVHLRQRVAAAARERLGGGGSSRGAPAAGAAPLAAVGVARCAAGDRRDDAARWPPGAVAERCDGRMCGKGASSTAPALGGGTFEAALFVRVWWSTLAPRPYGCLWWSVHCANSGRIRRRCGVAEATGAPPPCPSLPQHSTPAAPQNAPRSLLGAPVRPRRLRGSAGCTESSYLKPQTLRRHGGRPGQPAGAALCDIRVRGAATVASGHCAR